MKARGMSLLTYADGSTVMQVTLDSSSVESARELYDELHDSDLEVSVTKFRKKRSLDANSYCWVLIGKIARAIHSTKDDVYRELIRSYSSKFIQMFVKNEEAETFKTWWQSQGLGNICVIYPYDDEQCEVRAYIGSSKFTTDEMSLFINLIVTECHELGISTATPKEISTMIENW